jgi:hypothetical protein
VRRELEFMSKTPQNTGEGNEPASPFEQTQRILNEIIERIRGLEWSEFLAKLDKKNETGKVKIIGNGIKTEHAEEREAAECEQIEAIENVKAAERLQRDCEYVRGLCKLTIEYKRESPEAIEAAKKVLELLPNIEKEDYSLKRELEDTLFILMEALRAENLTKEKSAGKGQKTLTLRQRIWIWVKRIPRWIYSIIVMVFVAVIATIIVDILGDYGWLERIKDFICKIFSSQ